MKIWITFVIALGILAGAHAQESVDLPPKDKFHLFLLTGQSNMAGRGKVANEDLKVHPRVLMLTKDLKWVPAVDPLHFDKKIAGVGLGKTFGIQIAELDPEITVGLIPCAVGGSPILAWEPGGYHPSTKTHPWDDMLPRAKAALEVGTLKAILWHQGESDSKEKLAPKYEARLHSLIARFRKELGAPKVPFIAGGMGNWPERPWDGWRKMVDQAHQQLPDHVEKTAFIGAEGLKHKGDEVHFDAESYRELGRRFADIYETMNLKSE
ncbi:MAG: sialate O-acetylesterase [Verrucomicrobiota bacterium]